MAAETNLEDAHEVEQSRVMELRDGDMPGPSSPFAEFVLRKEADLLRIKRLKDAFREPDHEDLPEGLVLWEFPA